MLTMGTGIRVSHLFLCMPTFTIVLNDNEIAELAGANGQGGSSRIGFAWSVVYLVLVSLSYLFTEYVS